MSEAILQAPDPRLRQVSSPVTEFGPPVTALVARMEAAMARGVGLAAIQLGVPLRVVVVGFQGKVALCNPVIRSRSKAQMRVDEGCLSVEGGARTHWGVRSAEVYAEWQDVDGVPRRGRFKGLRAFILQHEVDHLDGILFTDHLPGAKP